MTKRHYAAEDDRVREEIPTMTLVESKEPAEGSRPERPEPSDHGETERSSETALFAEDQLAGLRARWDTVQAGFVDDPGACVQQADSLVSDVVSHLTTGFADVRSRLEHQWGRGEAASTEDLRIALKRYREFFDRLLEV